MARPISISVMLKCEKKKSVIWHQWNMVMKITLAVIYQALSAESCAYSTSFNPYEIL
jgi:hypothetical protein